MRNRNSTTLNASVTLLALTLAGCSGSTVRLQSADDRRLPVLPEQARASRVPTPSECSPTCLSALTSERKRLQDTLTASGLRESPANGSTTQ